MNPSAESSFRSLRRFSTGAAIGALAIAGCFEAASADALALSAPAPLDPTFNLGTPVLRSFGNDTNNPSAATGDRGGIVCCSPQ